MPRYEFSEDSSNKFWEITLEGSSFTTRWGKIGTNGQEKTQNFGSEAEAKKEYEKIIASKVKKGYELVEGGDEDEGSDDSGGELASNPELEAAISKNVEDPQPYLLYADWLQGQGDPRGELISVQHARSQKDTPELQKREEQLLRSHQETMFGELAELLGEGAGLSVEWRYGFLRRVRVARDEYDSDVDVGETLKQVLSLPIARFVEEISIGLCEDAGDGDLQAGIDALVELKQPQTLRSLFLGDFQYPEQSEMSWTRVGDVSKLYKVFPRLRSLKLRGASAELGAIALPELKEFTFETGGLPADCITSICQAKWPKLAKLEVWFGDDNYGAEGTFDSIEPILAGTGLPEVTHLGLVNCSFLTGNISQLAESKLLPKLQKLDLSKGTLADEDAEAFVAAGAAFKHLELDVSDNFFTDRGIGLLKKLVKNLTSTEQREPYDEEDDRYVAVGE